MGRLPERASGAARAPARGGDRVRGACARAAQLGLCARRPAVQLLRAQLQLLLPVARSRPLPRLHQRRTSQ